MVEVFYGYLRFVPRTMMTWDALMDDPSLIGSRRYVVAEDPSAVHVPQ